MKKLFSFTTALCLSMSVSASDLEQVYQLALQNDVEIAAARATREAGSYNIKIARGALLPQAEASFSRTKINTQGESLNFATQQYEDTENDFT
ncbi:MAG: TolC family protein, partial [Oleibacter sp.]|nr:TolC family protein [Thalassolituus sp.]